MYNSDPPSNTHLNVWQQWAFRIEQRLQEQEDIIRQLQLELEQLKQQSDRAQSTSIPTFHVDKIEYRFDQLKVETLEGSLQIGLSTSNPEQLPLMIEDIMMQQQSENAAAYGAASNSNLDKNSNKVHKSAQNPQAGQSFGNSSVTQPCLNKTNTKLNYLQEKFSTLRNKQANEPVHHSDQTKPIPKQNEISEQPSVLRSDLAKQHVIDACLQMMLNELNDHFHKYIRRQSSLFKIEINDEHMMLIVEDIERQLPARIHYYVHEQHARMGTDAEQLIHQVLQLTRDDIESAIDQYIYQLSNPSEEERS